MLLPILSSRRNVVRSDPSVVLMAVRLIQPGLLGDVYEGVLRLVPTEDSGNISKEDVKAQLLRLKQTGLVMAYEGRRYMLTESGRAFIAELGLKVQIDARRMHLLKETRPRRLRLRSGTRDGSLQQ